LGEIKMIAAVVLFLIILVHIFILLKINFFPYPELFLYPFLIKTGFLPYKQIFDQHFPGLWGMSFNIYDLGLRSPDSARLFLVSIVSVAQILLFLISRKLFSSKFLPFLACFVYLILQPLFDGYVLWIDTFIVPLFLSSFYLFLLYVEKEKVFYLILCGVLAGLMIFLKQPAIVFSGILSIGFFLKRKSLREPVIFLSISLIPLLALVAWSIDKGILKDFLYWTVSFNFLFYSSLARKIPNTKQLIVLLANFVPVLLIFIYFLKKDLKIFVLCLLAFSSIFFILPRFEFLHLQPVLPLLVISLMALFQLKRKEIVLTVFSFWLATTAFWLLNFYSKNVRPFIYFFDAVSLETAIKIESMTSPSDRIFVFGSSPLLYYLSQRIPAGSRFVFVLPWYMKAAEDKILEGLKSDPPKLIIGNHSVIIDGMNVAEFSPRIEEYLILNYQMTDKVGENEIFVLK